MDSLRTDDFNKHIIERAKLILNAIEADTGKNIAVRDSKEVVAAFGDKL